jgi:hypothetical protein
VAELFLNCGIDIKALIIGRNRLSNTYALQLFSTILASRLWKAPFMQGECVRTNFFASGLIFWWIWPKTFVRSWQHCSWSGQKSARQETLGTSHHIWWMRIWNPAFTDNGSNQGPHRKIPKPQSREYCRFSLNPPIQYVYSSDMEPCLIRAHALHHLT